MTSDLHSPSSSHLVKSLPGTVYLVGAGPGDPGLMTIRGLECLQQADLVLYDGLVNPLLLRHTHAKAQRTCRVDVSGSRRLDQAEINRQLVEAAQSGLNVVRLKGGDPFVFGRGTEEAAALAAAGIPFEVVPGVTAATAAAVYTGISLTHRDIASSVAFVTGHEDPSKPESSLDYGVLARFPGTLVFYMGLHRLPAITSKLMEEGLAVETPTAVVSRATTPRQRIVEAPLSEIAAAVDKAKLEAPSLVIVGPCVRLRHIAGWFENRPLFGQRIAITRSEDQADSALMRAWQLGALPLALPTISIGPPQDWEDVDDALLHLDEFDWLIFTSTNGVHGLMKRVWENGGDMRLFGKKRLAAIGPGTAKALEKYYLRCDVVPAEYRAEALGEALRQRVRHSRVLWFRANRGRDVLSRQLREAGAELREVVVYQNEDVDVWPEEAIRALEAGHVDWLALSSPSIARNVARLLPEAARARLGQTLRVAAISPVTAAAAVEVGLTPDVVADVFTWDGIFEAIRRALPSRS